MLKLSGLILALLAPHLVLSTANVIDPAGPDDHAYWELQIRPLQRDE